MYDRGKASRGGSAGQEISLGPELEELSLKTADYIGLEQQQH